MKDAQSTRLGGKVRALRRHESMSQQQLAEKLGISASYLNLIENNRRPLPAGVLIKLAQIFTVDLNTFAADEDARLMADLMEAFADPLFEEQSLSTSDVREMVGASPAASRAVLSMYKAYRGARDTCDQLSMHLAEGDETSAVEHSHLPSEEVNDFIQSRRNHFPDLERGAEQLMKDARGSADDLYSALVRYLERAHGVHVQIGRWGSEKGVLRRYQPEKKLLMLSELLPTRGRSFQLAHQIALLTQREVFNSLLADAHLTTDSSRALARVALANYFSGAVLMLYSQFICAAKEERYDIDVLGRRFRVGFEQVCHRLTTLGRPGAEGVPFHMLRIDVAGNIGKRFSASGIRFARFAGVCPRWNIFSAFLTPGMIRIQLSRMPDGVTYFCVARTLQKDSGGYHTQRPIHAVGLGCHLQFARELVYSDGVDLDSSDAIVPVGVTCRVCERTDCEQRTVPSLKHPLNVNENIRGVSLYASVAERSTT